MKLLEETKFVDKKRQMVLGSIQNKYQISVTGLALVEKGFDQPTEPAASAGTTRLEA
jgi:hypothetical protein